MDIIILSRDEINFHPASTKKVVKIFLPELITFAVANLIV
jgi:hypothetical protein